MSAAYTILVVDDEQLITDVVTEVLTDEGYTVRVVHDGASALLSIRTEPPDLVILDVAMPVMTGEELLHTLRTGGYGRLPIIISTAGLHPERFLTEGANAILHKPFDLDQLLATVARVLSHDLHRPAAGPGSRS